jgi:hypothetical protein
MEPIVQSPMQPEQVPQKRSGPTPEQVLADLIPVAKAALENQARQVESQQQVQMRQLDLQQSRDQQQAKLYAESIQFQRHQFDLGFGLLTFGVLVVVAFSGGLMFLSGDVKSGMSILSHVGAVIAGLMTGLGWGKYRTKKAADDSE